MYMTLYIHTYVMAWYISTFFETLFCPGFFSPQIFAKVDVYVLHCLPNCNSCRSVKELLTSITNTMNIFALSNEWYSLKEFCTSGKLSLWNKETFPAGPERPQYKNNLIARCGLKGSTMALQLFPMEDDTEILFPVFFFTWTLIWTFVRSKMLNITPLNLFLIPINHKHSIIVFFGLLVK